MIKNDRLPSKIPKKKLWAAVTQRQTFVKTIQRRTNVLSFVVTACVFCHPDLGKKYFSN
jgi:hypothetical protein